MEDVGDPFQNDLSAGVLSAEVKADEEASEAQGAASAPREVDELREQRNEFAVVHLLDRCFDVGVVDVPALRAHRIGRSWRSLGSPWEVVIGRLAAQYLFRPNSWTAAAHAHMHMSLSLTDSCLASPSGGSLRTGHREGQVARRRQEDPGKTLFW
ncbi:hypothetical protein [Streptomyces sp. SD31]|uniref:hypothetical protein n=1 Tax=Streptomyces sp. SD31 TaxID=3452208 RepID=UPI003F88A74A